MRIVRQVFMEPARRWARGRIPWIRLPLLLWFAWVLFQHLINPDYQSILDPLNLGIHEFGHLVFSIGGEFLGFLGGTLMQLIAPAYGIYNFFRQEDYFSITLCFGWLSTNLFDIAVYVADARAQALQLVTPFGGHPIHDWHYILGRLNWLEYDQTLAMMLRGLAVVSMIIGLWSGGWVLWQMVRQKSA